MINWQELTIDMFVDQLRTAYQRTYGEMQPDFRNVGRSGNRGVGTNEIASGNGTAHNRSPDALQEAL